MFPVSVTIMVVKSPAKTYNHVQAARGCATDRDKDDTAAAITWRNDGSVYVAFEKSSISHDLIAHELNHAAENIFEYIESEPSKEIYHYVIGYLTARVYRLIKKYKIRLHK